MLSKCDHCGEVSVDDSENQAVCLSCGIVVEDIKFSHNPEFSQKSRGPFIPYSKSQAQFFNKKKKSFSLEHGQGVLDNLCHINNISSLAKSEIAELFKLILSVRKFKSREDAGATVACCLLLYQRYSRQAIALKKLCEQVPCTKGKFSYFLKYVKSCLASDAKFKNYSYLLDNGALLFVKKDSEAVPDGISSLIRVTCDKCEEEEKEKLIEKTTALVNLADSCWLLTGRSPVTVVVASAYLCWKSMHPMRIKTPFSKFCSKFEIREPEARRRIPELLELLLKLGKNIPAYSEDYINENNVLYHLNTILENSESLRNDLFPDLLTKKAVEETEYSNFRFKTERPPRKEPSEAVQYDSDMNASDIEISDTEIESYIIPETKKKVIEFCEKQKLNDVMGCSEKEKE